MLGTLDDYGVMTDCVNNAEIFIHIDTLASSSTNMTAAGLVGSLDNNGAVSNCVNNGAISYTAGNCGSYTVSPILGGIVGKTGNDVTISDCTNNGAIIGSGIATTSSSQTSIGGIVGSSRTASLSNCRNNADLLLSVTGSGSRAYVGGIVSGSNSTSTAISTSYNLTAENCSNAGKVEIACEEATNVAIAGGIMGGTGIALSSISGCENTGAISITCPTTVTGSNTGAGGIIGCAFNMSDGAEIAQCVNRGTVTAAANDAGGIAGQVGSGLLLTDCYNTASVTGTDYVGGIAGSLTGTLQSSFNYGGSVTTTSGSNVGTVVGSGAASSNTSSAYYLATTILTGAEAAADASYTTAKTAEEFLSYQLVYALNSVGSTVEDRGVWAQGDPYPQLTSGETTSVYLVKTASGDNGTVSSSADNQYLSEGDAYTLTFTPSDGYILKDFTVTDIDGNSYNIYLNSVENGVYSVTLEDADGNAYAASLSGNVLSCTMYTQSLTFTGEFTANPGAGSATVTLDGNGGWWDDDTEKTTTTLNAGAGALLTLADLPEPQSYRSFMGWYTDADGTAPYNFSTAITADTTLYAMWDANSCVVHYELNGGSWSAKNYSTISSGSYLSEPANTPEKEDCTFTGWYSDENCLIPFDFVNTVITGETTLYAGWIASGYNQVIFDPNGGTINGSTNRLQLSITLGTAIGSELDGYTVVNGDMTLRGWYTAAAGGSQWTLDDPLMGDMVLYAHWDAADGTPTIYSGTEAAPMEIEDLDQLETLRDNVNAGNTYAGCYFRIVNDLTLPAGWTPIGAMKPGAEDAALGVNIYPYSGTLDGGNHTVTILEDGLPLFGYVREATIQNLQIYGTKIAGYGLVNVYTVDYGTDGDYNTGTGGSYAAGCPDTVVIDNVTLKSGSSTLYAGFIGGGGSGGNTVIIRNSTIESGVVIGYGKDKTSIGSFAGGISGTVTNCTSAATVYGIDFVGGIIGSKAQSMGDCDAIGCVFTGTVVATGDYVGGITGGGYRSSSAPNSPCVIIQNCYVLGSITGQNYVGGILGAEPTVTQCWANGAGYIQSNYFSGTLTATADNGVIGGIIGYLKSLDRYNIIENNYYLNTSAETGIGLIDAIDYTTVSYGRSETFVADDVCIPTTSDDFVSGKIAALLNSGENSSGTWTQTGDYPVLGSASTATYAVVLSTVGSGTASATGLTTAGDTVYQNAGSEVTISTAAADGYDLARISVVYADGTTANITDSKTFTMAQQNATVYVTFAAEGEKYAESISITSLPDQTSYSKGSSFDVTGLTFMVTYSDLSTETIVATSDMVSGFSSSSTGTKTLTLTYLGCTATFTVNVSSGSTDTITVKFRLIGATLSDSDIDLGDGDYQGSEYVTWIKTTSFSLEKGSTVYDLFTEALDDAGLASEGADKNYVQTIDAPSVLGGYELSEFTNGKYSGWMYTVDGSHPNQGLKDYELSNGDKVIWHYVNDYRYEVEDWYDDLEYPSLATDDTYYNKWLEADDVKPTSSSGSSGSGGSGSSSRETETSVTLTPTVTASGGTATVSVSASDLSDAIGSAEEDNSDSIVIAPVITGAATKVTVTLPKTSLSSIVLETESDLTVETPVGNVTLPNDAMASIVSQASGSTVTVSLDTVDTSSLNEDQKSAVGDDPVYDISIISGSTQISSFGSGSITISLPYVLKNGESATNVTVWYLNDAGELVEMACTYDKSTGLATFTTIHLSYYVVGYEQWQAAFTDVASTDWYYSAVKYVVNNGLFDGTSSTTFAPNDDMTRAMLVTVLYRLEGEPVVTSSSSFTDVRNEAWYTDAVIWANKNGIVSGYGSGIFGTNDYITREQMAAILYNYAEYKRYGLTKTTELTSYSDAALVSAWAVNAMKWAVGEGLIGGTSSTTLSPDGNATRAQVATILMRFVESIVE